MALRQLVVLLHAHLPDCRCPEQPASLEETWFFEALAESYLPLLRTLDRLAADRVPVRLTVSLSPTLLCLLADEGLLNRFRRRLAATEELARREAETAAGPHRVVAAWHAGFFGEMRDLFEARCGGDVLHAFAGHHTEGRLELATTVATHAFLPAYQSNPAMVRAQLGVGLDAFTRAFGFAPEFLWLPECGYYPGLEEVLREFGIRGFALESHGVTQARPPPPLGVRAPLRCPNGVGALGRDAALSRLVWSASEGYPGHPDYREFHRDRIHALDNATVAAWLGGAAVRLPSGLKFWRVTGPHEDKAWYEPAAAAVRAAEHARDFVARLRAAPEERGIWFVPFDAELFGHWWFEGPWWLEQVFRLVAAADNVAPLTATQAIDGWADAPTGRPAASSWGAAGDFSYWVDHDNAWLYPRLNEGARRLQRLVEGHGLRPDARGAGRALRQAARTLLLAQASDWPFLLKAGVAREAALAQVAGLLERFEELCRGLETGAVDEHTLHRCEQRDAAFAHLDLRWFAPR